MARRPSIASHSSTTLHDRNPSLAQPKTNGLSTRAVSAFAGVDSALHHVGGSAEFDPDELFVKHTVSEVRSIQQRLRMDADAKQEELRLMVGERYRDLLQASTSIISMSETSKRVLNAFNEMRDVVASTESPQSSQRPSTGEDKHLQAMQQLSAHLKLLLDAPEHLWRLMEQKKFLHAAWLFLTTRIVQQTLLREEQDAEHSWMTFGIDVSEDLPLVQRQWETVSQFRPQIVHKAMSSLREHLASPADTCATLLTLHLLESRPLTETLSIFLSQRVKTLASILTRSDDQTPNGHASAKHILTDRHRKTVLRETRQKLSAVLDLVSTTMGTARVIFSGDKAGRMPMMQQALHFIQDGKAAPVDIPGELQLTTEALLRSLPSSAHFLLLPSSIRSYRPYVGGSSQSSVVPQDNLEQKLGSHFDQCIKTVQGAMEQSFSVLGNAREVWSVRVPLFHSVSELSGLTLQERDRVQSVIDEVSRRRVIALWKSALDAMESTFAEHLRSALQALTDSSESVNTDVEPAQYLFQAPPTPSVSQVSLRPSLAAASFQRYKSTLHRQLHARTPLLEDVLGAIEHQTTSLEEDMRTIGSGDDVSSRDLASQLVECYRPNADALCRRISSVLYETADDADLSACALVFVGRIAHDFASSSGFVTTIGCNESSVNEFRTAMHDVDTKTYERWRNQTVRCIIARAWPNKTSNSHARTRLYDKPSTTRPSSSLLQALSLLGTSLQEYGTFVDIMRRQRIAGDSLRYLVSQILDHLYDESEDRDPGQTRSLYDVSFMRRLAELWGKTWPDLIDRLDSLTSKMRVNIHQDLDSVNVVHLTQMQVLFAPLLPLPSEPASTSPRGTEEKATSLLPYGPPVVGHEFRPALDVAKPSARFGLLLIGSAPVR